MRLCRAALAAGFATDDANACLARAGGVRRAAAAEPHQTVAVFTLGHFGLLVGGQPVVVHGRWPQRPLELLQALIALGGVGVPVDTLIHAVWPGDTSTDPHNLFDNTLHRLRHLLACDEAISRHDGKVWLDARRCWIDAWAFDRLAEQVLSGLGEPGAAAAQALSLYHGPFLAREAPHAWASRCRDRLHARFVRLVAFEAQRLEALGRWHEAAACLERGVDVDPAAEALVLPLMAGHARRGAASDALRVYARCRSHLAHAHGAAPSAAVEALRSTAAAAWGAALPSFLRRL